jgi:hypothetical protein
LREAGSFSKEGKSALGWVDDVGEAQPDHLLIRVPAAILTGHLLFEILGEGVDDFWCRWDVLVEWHVRRWVIERVAKQRLAGGPDQIVNLEQFGGLEDVEGRHQVVVEGGDVGREGRTRNGGEMDDGMDAAVNLVYAGEASTTWP